jgi:NAD(P)-dependent dehydrogenase (short-subunit alcohol dehydrogenase family)
MSQVVVVTGASAGVGRAVVRAYARRGARIGLLARGRERLEATRREVEALGGAGLVVPVDVAHAAMVEAAATAVEEAFGPIDVWVNNAMASVFSPVARTPAGEFRRVTDVTYLGYVHGTLAALQRMLPRDHGVIVQVGSALAYRGIPLQAAYCAAKHAIQGFVDSLRTELMHDGSRVRVVSVHMPALNTPQFDWVKSRLPRRAQPVPPIYQPELAAEAVLWAADHRRAEVHLGLSTVAVIWGSKLFPRLADLYLARTGYESQQTAEPVDPGRPHNLWEPVPGDPGARGDFDHRAWGGSVQFALSRRRGWLVAGAAAGAALWAIARSRRAA